MNKVIIFYALLFSGYVGFSQVFTPTSLNPDLWLDASDASTIVESSGMVSAWNDKSGNNLNAVQPNVGNQPIYLGTANGIEFDGVNDLLSIPHIAHGDNQSLTVFVAGYVDAADSNTDQMVMLSKGSSLTTNSILFKFKNSNSQIKSGLKSYGGTGISSVDKRSVHHFSYENGSLTGSFNGIWKHNIASGFYSDTNPISIGALPSFTFPLGGEVYEILIFRKALTICDQEAVIGYLANKWNTASTLKEGHPYKDVPFGLCSNSVLEIDENSPNNAPIGIPSSYAFNESITVTNWIITNEGSFSGIFDINNNTGEIFVKNNSLLDYEFASNHTITVGVEIDGQPFTGDVEINILDVDDPVIEKIHSQLWGENGELWNSYSRLPDFSSVGYKGGEQSYAYPSTVYNILDFGVIPNDEIGDGTNIQAAINSISEGIIDFPAGTYYIDVPITINKPNIVIRGVGTDSQTGTVFYMPNSATDVSGAFNKGYANGDSGFFITFEGVNAALGLSLVNEDSYRGDRSVTVDNGVKFSPGQTIIIIYKNRLSMNTDLWHHLHNDQTNDWTCTKGWADAYNGINMAHTVERVDGNVVTFREPLRLDILVKWQPQLKIIDTKFIGNCGIENIRFSHKTEVQLSHGFQVGHNSVMFNLAYNCWATNLVIEDADNGITFKRSLFSEMRNIQFEGRAGHHGTKLTYSSNCLQEGMNFNNDDEWTHHITLTHKTHGCAISNVTGINDIRTDFHRNAPFENLFTNFQTNWNYLSSGDTCAGPHSAARSVFWNMQGACGAPSWDDYQTTIVSSLSIPEKFHAEKGWHENIPNIEPANLQVAQLNRKLNPLVDPEFQNDNAGDHANWKERDPARWKIKTDDQEIAYNLFANPAPLTGNRLGEYAVYNQAINGDALISADAATLENLILNKEADLALLMNYLNDENYYYALFSSDITKSGIFKVENAVAQLIAAIPVEISNYDFRTYAFARDGGNLVVYVDGNEFVSTFENSFSDGKVGIGSLDDSVSFDNIFINNSGELGVSSVKLLDQVTLFPNPTTNIIQFFGRINEVKSTVIYNSIGQSILRDNKTEINVSNLPAGLYFAVVEFNSGNKQTHRFIKK